MKNRLEDNMQIACVNYFYAQYPEYKIMSYPAGFVFQGNATQRAITGRRMKDMGYLVGTPDLFIPVARNGYNGLFIELKTGKNRLTKEQKTVSDFLMYEGFDFAVCYSVDGFIQILDRYLGKELKVRFV